jgi:electron transport complex protein RnfG
MTKTMLKLGLTLALFAGVACAGLSVVYSLTKQTIDAQQSKDLNAALQEIFPGADQFDEITASLSSPDPRILIGNAYAIKKGGTLAGIAVKAAGPSYGGSAVILSGFTPDKKVAKVVILELLDTPGLGANAANPNYFVDKPNKITFPGQFEGKSIADAFEVKADVEAITASTITSRAIAEIIKTSGDAAAAYLDRTGGAR